MKKIALALFVICTFLSCKNGSKEVVNCNQVGLTDSIQDSVYVVVNGCKIITNGDDGE